MVVFFYILTVKSGVYSIANISEFSKIRCSTCMKCFKSLKVKIDSSQIVLPSSKEA